MRFYNNGFMPGRRGMTMAAIFSSIVMTGGPAMANQATQANMIQAEAQAQIARATMQAASALNRLDQGPVDPQQVSNPAGLETAAPAAPVATPRPNFKLADLPPELRRPVTIKWQGTVTGALKKIAQNINYTYLKPPAATVTPPMVTLDMKNKPAADVLYTIGTRVSQFGKVVVNPNSKTIQFVAKKGN